MFIKKPAFNNLLNSQKLLWLAIIVLFILYLHTTSSIKSFENKVDTLSDDDNTEQIEKFSKEISSLKKSLCASISRLFELNGRFYSCVIGGLN